MRTYQPFWFIVAAKWRKRNTSPVTHARFTINTFGTLEIHVVGGNRITFEELTAKDLILHLHRKYFDEQS